MPKTILVTGATGTVGSEVVKQLSRDASNYNIKAAIHSIENAKKIQQYDRVKAVQIDYDKQEGLESAFKDSDKLFLLTHPSSKSAEHESNLITEAKKSGIKHIVKQSIMHADLGADVEAMRLHRQTEKLIEETNIPYTFLRPPAFMQNFVNFYSQTIKEQGAFYLPAEDAKVNFVDARDIADDGTKGEILSNSEAMGQKVFVCDSKDGNVFRTTIIRRWWDDKCQDSNTNNNSNKSRSHHAVIELPPDWIGKKVHIRPFEIIRM